MDNTHLVPISVKDIALSVHPENKLLNPSQKLYAISRLKAIIAYCQTAINLAQKKRRT